MLVCFGLFGLLLFNTVVANAVCSFTYSKKDEIRALSLQYESKGYRKCDYNIHAPRNNYIKLNFTNFFGFHTQPSMHSGYLKPDSDLDLCIPPEIVIREKEEDSDLQLFVKICKDQNNLQSPTVFHSTLNYLKITYIWIENQSSGFTLDFEFRHNNNCVHICDDHRCLSDSSLLCNSVYECRDQSDEHNCPRISQSTGSEQSTDVDLIKTVVILISVVLMPGLFVIICVVSPCRLRSRMWRRRRRSRETLEHNQLRPNSQASEVVYVPTSTTSQEQLLEQQMSLVRERQVKLQSFQTDTMLDLPPQIPISKDGEEGYIDSQKHLMLKRSRQISDNLCFRPPPNKNVHDIDLERPPPYYSNSSSLENIAEPPTRIVRNANGSPVMLRCYSMSSNGQKSEINPALMAKTHSRTMSTNSTGRTRTVLSSSHLSEHLDEPPDYSAFSSDNSTQNSPTLDNKV